VRTSPNNLFAIVISALLAAGLSVAAHAASEDAPQPVTTSDPAIPSDELALLLKPLSKDELLIEADGWQDIVKAKAAEIAHAEIAVRRQNKAIDKAEEVKEKAEAAREHLEEVADKVEEARETGNQERMAEAKEAVAGARDSVREIDATVAETAASDREAAEDTGAGTAGEARQPLEATAEAADQAAQAVADVEETIESAEGESSEDVKAIAAKAQAQTAEAQQATEEVKQKAEEAVAEAAATAEQAAVAEAATEKAATLDEAAEKMEQAGEARKAEKIDLLEQVTSLREDRTLLIDNMRTVVDELEAKTDKDDADTLARIADYRLYMRSVSGISLDVTDTTSAWVSISGWVTSEEGGIRWIVNIAKFVGILVLAWFVAKILSGMARKGMGKLASPALLSDFLVRSVRWVVMIIGIIWALSALEISVAPLLALVGAAGFIIAFAMQDSLSNFASGLMILFFRPFDMGDVVDAGGVSGKVSSMNLVSTTIKTFDNKLMVVPNSKIWSDVITNATGVNERRVDMEFGIGYDDDIDQAQEILEEIVTSHPKVLKDPEPLIKMSALADSSVNFICRPWATPADYWEVYWDITKEVKKRFDAAGIGIPFPQRDVHLYIEKGGDNAQAAISPQASRATHPEHPQGTQTDGGFDT
jgi:small conductance mechanosensitive channel